MSFGYAIDNLFIDTGSTITARTEKTTYEASGLNNDGLYDWYRSADIALDLDGSNDYATHPNDASFNITGNHTFEALINPDSVTGTQRLYSLFGTSNPNRAYMFYLSNDEIVWQCYNAVSGTGSLTTTAANLVIGTDYRIKLVYDASSNEVSFFLNGTEIARGNDSSQTACTKSGTIPTSIQSSGEVLGIGARSDGADKFNGKIAYIGIASAKYDHGGYLDPSTCEGYWDFDDSDLTDSSPNSHTLTGVSIEASNYVDYTGYQWVRVNLDATQNPTQYVIPRNHNLTGDAKCQIKLLRQGPFDAFDVVDTISTDIVAGQVIDVNFSSTTETDWWFEIHDPDNSDDYITIPYIYLGDKVSLTTDFKDASYTLGRHKATVKNRNPMTNSRTYKLSETYFTVDGALGLDVDSGGNLKTSGQDFNKMQDLAEWCSDGKFAVIYFEDRTTAYRDVYTWLMEWTDAEMFDMAHVTGPSGDATDDEKWTTSLKLKEISEEAS